MTDNEADKAHLSEFLAAALKAEMTGQPVNQFAAWLLSDEWTDPSYMGYLPGTRMFRAGFQTRGHRVGRLVEQFADAVQGEVES